MTSPAPDVAGLPFGWGAIFGLINVLGLAGAFATWLKNRPKMRELEKAADEKLRDDLIKRVDRLERQLENERGRQEVERARHEATLQVMRHRLNNSDQCLDALLLLLEAAPDRAADAVSRIKEMRSRHREAEAIEKAAIRAAEMAAAELAAMPQPAGERP